jgi:lysophospholipase
MLELDTGAFPEAAALTIASGVCSRGSGKSFAVGQTHFDPTLTFEDPDNVVTHSRARFDLKMATLRAHPELALGGVSYRWLCEALQATSFVQTLGKYSNVPMLLFQAGSDTLVEPGAQNRYCDEAARCQMVAYDGSYHEVLMERDAIRNDALTKAIRFYRAWGG